MTRLLTLMAACGLLFCSAGCCCQHLFGGGYGACYPPAGPCPGGACGVGAVPGPGVAQVISPNAVTTTASGPVAIGPIIPGQVTYHVPTTTTTYLTTPLTTTATLQPLPTY